MLSGRSRKAWRWKVPNRMWLCDSRVSTAERVGLGSSPRTRSSPVSTREKAREVGTPRASSIVGGQDLAHPALQGQPPVAGPRPRRLARALGGQVQQAAASWRLAQLGEQEAAAVAQVGVVAAELVAVIAHGQRCRAGCPATARSARNGPAIPRRSAPPAPRVAAARSLRNRRIVSGKSAGATGSANSGPRRMKTRIGAIGGGYRHAPDMSRRARGRKPDDAVSKPAEIGDGERTLSHPRNSRARTFKP
jgi:hypothetical protein